MNAPYKQLFDKLSVANDASNVPSGVNDPNWLMGISKLTKSKIEGFKNYCQIIDHEFAMNRGVESSIVKDVMKPNGGLIGYDLKVIVPSSSVNADAHLYFYQNHPIKTVSIVRIGRINTDTPQTLESYTFTQCYITSMITKGDVLAISFRYSAVERKTPEIKKNGSARGMHAAQHNFMTIKSDQGTPVKKAAPPKKKKKAKKKNSKKK
ncbi:hypothetical protein [Alphaproteobacteria bacterium endosymbiont of Tiliacea citrago]|uniref:hypothetical protein n=1 Tax=Alphaproteobacteria bacterium endosymbiont of Tiliacea citrago TaxID=3077944 RepID=UPI00313B2E9A